MKLEHQIRLKDDAAAFCQKVPRRVPLPLLGKLEAELDRLSDLSVIEAVDEPTDWCAPIVVVPKANGSDVRLCVDLTKLNKHVKREIYSMPTVQSTLNNIAEAKGFRYTF